MKKKIKTKESFLKKILDKLLVNKIFNKYSDSNICYDNNYIVSPVDWNIANIWKISKNWEFISKWWKKVNLNILIWEKSKNFQDYTYINIYLSPKNRHFFTMPYDWKIINTFPNNWTAIFPLFIWIENFFKIEVFHKAIIKNATISSIIETSFWNIWFIAVWSLNVNHIIFEYKNEKKLKKWEKFGHFSLWSSVILIIPSSYEIIKKQKESVKIWEKLVKIL